MINSKIYLLFHDTWSLQRDAIYPIEQKVTKDESYDDGTIVLHGTARETQIPDFTKCKVVSQDENNSVATYSETQYYYVHDVVDQIRLMSPPLYKHTMMLIEPTKMLERYIIAGMDVYQPLRPNIPLSISMGGLNGAELTVVLPDGAMTYALPSNGKVQIPVPAVKKGEQKYRYEAIIGDTKYTRSDAGYLEVPYNGEAKFTVTIHNPSGGSVDFATTYDIMTTAPQKSVADVIDDLLAVTPFRRLDEAPMFYLDETIRERLSHINSCTFRWSCKMTLFECLHEVGKLIGAMPRLTANPQDDRKFDTITFDFFGDDCEDLSNVSYSALQLDNDIERNSDAIETYAENLVAQADEPQSTTTWPSKNGWVTPRTTKDIRIVEDNAEIVLPENIDRVIKVLVKGFTARGLKVDEDGKITQESYQGPTKEPVDITDYIVPFEQWQLLKTLSWASTAKGGEKWKNNTLYYEKNGNKIFPMGKTYKEMTSSVPVIAAAISTSLKKESLDEGKEIEIIDPSKGEVKIKFDRANGIVNLNIFSLQFQIEYIPLAETKLRAIKQNRQGGGTIAYNQQTEYADARSLGANLWGTCQAMGAEETKVGEYYSNLCDLPKLGQKFQDRVVSSVQRTILSPYNAMAQIVLSRDFNRLNERIEINRKYRQWNIPAESTTKHFIYEEYCVISNTLDINTSICNDNFISILKNTLEVNKFNGNTEIDCATLQGNSGGTWLKKVLLSVQSRGAAKSIAFTFSAEDNYSAGVQKDGDVIIDVGYGDDNARIDYAGIDFGTDLYDGYSPDQLPYCPRGIKAAISAKFPINKSEGERLAMTYQMHFVTDLPNIVIGDMLAERCPLVRSFDGPKVFQLWRLNKRVSKFTQKITQEYGAMVGNANITTAIVNSSIRVLIDTPSSGVGWAITDAAGNLYLAENAPGGSTKTFYLNLKKYFG